MSDAAAGLLCASAQQGWLQVPQQQYPANTTTDCQVRVYTSSDWVLRLAWHLQPPALRQQKLNHSWTISQQSAMCEGRYSPKLPAYGIIEVTPHNPFDAGSYLASTWS